MLIAGHERCRWVGAMLALAALVGCGGTAGTTGTGQGAAGSTSSSSGTMTSTDGQGGGGGSEGPGTINGTAGGKVIDKVASAYFIGQSDDSAHTTTVYVFDTEVACADLAAPGWDKKITNATGALEMKLIGTTPGVYAVSKVGNPAQGEAAVNFTLSSTTSTPVENSSNGGSVQLDILEADKLAGGSFDLQFPDGSLKGTFAASWCPGGHEP